MPNPASSGLPNPASYTDNGDGTVTDNVTKLVWQKAVTSSQAYAWCDAINYCATLTLAGRTWRLPTRIELLSLVDFTRTSPAINTTAFPSVPGGKYHWTSSPWVVSQIATKAQDSWIVNFSEGLTSNAGNRTDAEYARCVSAPDEGALPSPRYVSVATGEVQDVDTKLDLGDDGHHHHHRLRDRADHLQRPRPQRPHLAHARASRSCRRWSTRSRRSARSRRRSTPRRSRIPPRRPPTGRRRCSTGCAPRPTTPWVINYEDGFTEYNQTAALVRCVR